MRLLTSIYLIWGYILKMEKVFFELLRLAIEDGQWLTVNRQRSTDNGQQTTVNGQ
jgi:ssDNA-specific exonuclease RecJ